MNEEKVAQLHSTLLKLQPGRANRGLGRAPGIDHGQGGHKHRDNGLPKNGLYTYFVKEGHFRKTFDNNSNGEPGKVERKNSKKEKRRKRPEIENVGDLPLKNELKCEKRTKKERGEASKTDKRRKEISSGIAPQSEEVIKAAKRDMKAEDGSGVKRKKAMKDKKGRKNDIADGVQLFFKEHEVAAKRDKKVEHSEAVRKKAKRMVMKHKKEMASGATLLPNEEKLKVANRDKKVVMGLIPSKKAKKNKTKRRNDGDITDGVHKTEKVRLKAMQQGTISKSKEECAIISSSTSSLKKSNKSKRRKKSISEEVPSSGEDECNKTTKDVTTLMKLSESLDNNCDLIMNGLPRMVNINEENKFNPDSKKNSSKNKQKKNKKRKSDDRV